jgi:hypothetical protein
LTALYFDHNVSLRLAAVLRGWRHDVATARDIGTSRWSDGRHLLMASDLGRVLITHNERDFVLLHDAWVAWGAAWGATARHHGIVVLPQREQWSPLRAANEIEGLTGGRTSVAAVPTFSAQLFVWRPSRGWHAVAIL